MLQSMVSQTVKHNLVTEPSLNYGGGNEDNCDLVQKVPQKHCYTQCPQACSRPLSTHWQAWARLLWGHCFFLWVLALTRFCLCPPRVCSPVLCTFWRLYGGLMVTSSKRASAMPRSTAPRAPAPAAVHCRWTRTSSGDTQT